MSGILVNINKNLDLAVQRSILVLQMVSELHKVGHQRLRIMPAFSPSGAYWRLTIGPDSIFSKTHGALVEEASTYDAVHLSIGRNEEVKYFGWEDASTDNAYELAVKFLERFPELSRCGRGWDYEYSGWFQRLLGLAERGWLPYICADYQEIRNDFLYLHDGRFEKINTSLDEAPKLPNPPLYLLNRFVHEPQKREGSWLNIFKRR
ncbi:hypothetical protein [Swingsia samuiensis]|uniref:Uncharacterized protein n=1 Tax=Swingsia samuiensis TaxID=1293412 RepID=A0A4Y6ULI4_9PROT|nr:hypothetical protein [Swingsia samuiensis]QDH17241.1 hypothetical protein E3D00_06460 [Swingsia samuiensis]